MSIKEKGPHRAKACVTPPPARGIEKKEANANHKGNKQCNTPYHGD